MVQRQRLELLQLIVHRLLRDAAHHQPQPPGTIAAVDPVTAFRRQAGAQQFAAKGLLGLQVAFHKQAAPGGAQRLQPQGEFGDQRQAAPAAAEQPHQVVARHVLHHPSPGMGFDAIRSQQADANDLIAHPQMALPQSPRQSTGHQAADASGSAGPGPVNGQPLPLLRQQILQVLQWQAGFHRDGQIVHGMVDHPVELPAGEHLMAGIQRWTPVQACAQATGTPGGAALVPLAHQINQSTAAGGGMAHGTMVP